jgi:hypothetical protein
MDAMELRREYDRLTAEGVRLAGRLADVPQRAAVYHHIFFESGRNHVFPLIAAHGALWARGYFAFGMRLANWLSWQYALDSELRHRQLQSVAAFADVLRDINRRVCADTYASFHFVSRYGGHPEAARIVEPALLDSLLRVYSAREAGRELADVEKLAVFRAHFLNEQTHVVGPTITQALVHLRWPLVRLLALKPLIRFSYFPRQEWLWFGDFASRDERISNGLKAFELAAQAGWQVTAGALREYAVLPSEFFVDARRHFAAIREAALAVTAPC